MKTFRLLVSIALSLALSAQALAQAEPPTIETLMSSEELRATGIDQLSPGQLQALNAWLQRFAAGEVVADIAAAEPPAPPVSATTTASTPASTPATPPSTPSPRYGQRVVVDETIRSRILGDFRGWNGDTRFELDNGQLWEQRRPGRYRTTLANPDVIIKKNLFGAWDLELVEGGASIGVRRLR